VKWIKRIGITILLLPVILIIVVISYEIFGMCMNHRATDRQTGKLEADIREKIGDVKILGIYSETGNTSGTGNHVECLSVITFSTELTAEEIREGMSEAYTFDGWDCYLKPKDEGFYTFYLRTSAPFPNNIEGH
jgi:hypothetical protein